MFVKRLFAFVVAALLVTFAGGCVHDVTLTRAPDSNLNTIKKVHVVLNPDDMGWATPPYIKSAMESRGYTATVGFATEAPKDADALLVPNEKWMWDITMYLLSADLTMKDAKTGKILAAAHVQSSSFGRKSPEIVANEMVGEIFGAQTPKK